MIFAFPFPTLPLAIEFIWWKSTKGNDLRFFFVWKKIVYNSSLHEFYKRKKIRVLFWLENFGVPFLSINFAFHIILDYHDRNSFDKIDVFPHCSCLTCHFDIFSLYRSCKITKRPNFFFLPHAKIKKKKRRRKREIRSGNVTR